MPFMVIYRTSDGTSTYEQLEAIDEAALFVERLRNNEGVDQIRIYRMEEISFAFRPYYKVELGMPERQQHPSPPTEVIGVTVSVPADPEAEPEVAVDEVAPLPEAEPGGPEPVDVTDAPAPTAAPTTLELGPNGVRRGLFGR